VVQLAISSWDYRRALAELWSRSSYERGYISDPFGAPDRAEQGLERMRLLLGELGNPHLRVPAAHVAGSKGKGSTSEFLASMAIQAGHRVGLYTSPHLHRFPERIAVNGRPVTDQEFAQLAEQVAAAAAGTENRYARIGRVSTFEFVTAMAFVAFATFNCDLSVIEVGLGGRYDATNVLDPLVTVITRIDLEHTSVLGSTYREIAYQKAGILRSGVACVSSPQVEEAETTISSEAKTTGATLLVGGRDWTWRGGWRKFDATGPWGTWKNLSLGIVGSHQVENATTALAASSVIDAAGIPIPEEAAREGLAKARWPGRFEITNHRGRVIVFDGAHSPASASATVSAWKDDFGFPNATVVFGTGADKNASAILRALEPVTDRMLITRATSPRAASPEYLASVAEELGIRVETHQSVASAMESAIAGSQNPLLVTGSLFVAAEAREVLGLAQADTYWEELNSNSAPERQAVERPPMPSEKRGIEPE
jgi:dihydrofolate synthase/folylpolyglutamate synthase